MKRRRSNTLVALSSAAVMTVYAAGFMRTRAAAERLEHSSRERPPVLPAPAPVPLAAAAPTALFAPVVEMPKATADKKTRRPDPVEPTAGATPAAAPTESTPAPVAPVVAEPVATPAPPAVSPSAEVLLGGTELHDGTFLGWGTSRHGDLQASVTIYSGRITAVSIAQCRTRYSCDVIAHLPAKVLNDQTPEKINNVSGATQSVDAFYWAVMDAMSKAK